MQPRPTLKSLAATLGLHVSTVSRILNGAPEAAGRAASPEVVGRVRALARELNYRPNPQALSLKTQRSRDVGVLLPRLADPLAARLFEGIEDAAQAAGYSVFACPTQDDPRRSLDRAEKALQRQVAGLVLGDCHLGDTRLLDTLAAQRVPYVLVGRQQPGQPGIGCDDEAAGRAVAEHFLRKGRRRLGVLAGPAHSSPGQDALRGFAAACQQAGVPLAPEQVVHGAVSAQAGREQGERLLGLGVDAVFALDDLLALGVASAAQARGQLLGRELALVGYNDLPWAAELPVPLASVSVPAERMGRLALQMLLRRVDGKAANPLVLAPEVLLRASAG
ncbi:substrate-binding domain-containing protein [Pseudomonas sp. NPDC007930]|uniref:LacI family DNA-binding transcriptional regulator n=1 Tax=Pseudomonas sp. NPDC007930 TaxID=3364417 RepID=UPI0036EB6377